MRGFRPRPPEPPMEDAEAYAVEKRRIHKNNKGRGFLPTQEQIAALKAIERAKREAELACNDNRPRTQHEESIREVRLREALESIQESEEREP
jgi:hypothetical protein